MTLATTPLAGGALGGELPAGAAGPATAVVLTLTSDGTTPRSNLSGLKWAFFEQATPDLFVAPFAKGLIETTDAAGVLSIDITGTTLLAGATGWLTVTDSDGTATQSPPHRAFSGPVVVS